MSLLSRDLVFLVLQFLDEEKYSDSVHRLEKESGYFFNMSYFEHLTLNGDWDEVEGYLSGFTKVDDNRYSMKMFFEIRKQKYLEALDMNDRPKAVDILMKDLKVFSTSNVDIFKEMTLLLSLENFRQHEHLSTYIDTNSARTILLLELKKLIEANPLLREKLYFPSLQNSRLRTMINQGLNWQHHLCKNPRPNPEIKTLFVDHSCGQSQQNAAQTLPPIPNTLFGANVPNPGGFLPLMAHGPFQSAPSPLPTSFAGWMANSQVLHPSVSAGPIGFTLNNTAVLKRPRTPTSDNAVVDFQIANSEHVLKRARPFGMSDEGNIIPVNFTGPSHGQTSYSSNDLPKAVVMTLNQGSAVRSMDFHPLQQSLLLVGTNTGEIMVWALCAQERLAHRTFKVWDLGACSATLQTSLPNDYSATVNRVIWSPDGALFGVAYSKHIVHIYSYHGGHDLGNHLEIEAHAGSVNDLAFSCPNEQLFAITCGEDRLVKVWDAITGTKQFTFEGHEAPVYSICPHFKEDRQDTNYQYIFATSTDGKIKAWLYDNNACIVDYNAPGYSTITLAYSSDGKRLFSCGSNKEGDSYLVEWDDNEGAIKRSYLGLGMQATGIVQFDTTKNRFLAVGDEFSVKFWDMDNVNLLATVKAEGGLPASPCIRFNKEGKLLAVSTNENGIKILANTDGLDLLRTVENRPFESSRAASAAIIKSPSNKNFGAGTLGSSFTNRIGSMASRGATVCDALAN
ncbi:hypothetical protein Leryth_006613 [Lithospermum erythrorhizon]|nr:hypothetical protein Leryth_006613 [Lithospermum erythrorhizon]